MNSFFYIMVLTHNNKVGFGITGNVHSRIFDYIAGSGELQSFKYLYYGSKDAIVNLEKTLKASWKPYMWNVFKGNKWTLEILDPKTNLTAEDVKNWVESEITRFNLPIKAMKDEWLPYQGDKRVNRTYINLNPNIYLET